MDAKQFIAEFGHIVDGPSGVDELRKLVLHLAVTGKLVSSKGEATAKSFLEEIEIVQQERVASKEIKQNKKIEPLPSKFPFEIPNSWQWVRFGNLCHFVAGRTPPRKESVYWNTGEYPWFSIADMSHQEVISVSSETISQEAREKSFKCPPVKAGTLIMSFKLTIGRLSVLGIDAYHNEAIISIFPFASELNDYFLKCLNGFDLSSGNKAAIKGNTLNQDSISNILVAVPPKDDIPKLLAKVDELISLCDQLEQQQQHKRQLQNQLRKTALRFLSEAKNPIEFKQHWERVDDTFGDLFPEPSAVQDLRDSVLNLASSGSLSSANENDSSVTELISGIKCDQEEILTNREKKELNQLPKYEIESKNRIKIALGHLVKIVSGQHLKPDEYTTSKIGVPYITGPAEFKDGFPSPVKWTETKKAIAKNNDILITVKGSGVGKTAICNVNELAISRQLMAIRPLGILDYSFVHLCIDAAKAQFQKQKLGIAIPGIGREEVMFLLVSLPCIEEQRRIVALTKLLMEKCDQLERKIAERTKTSTQLAEAAIASLTGMSITLKEDILKTPTTQLVAPITLGKKKPSSKDDAPLATLLARQSGKMNANDLWQRFGGEIDAFYAQLKVEVAHGWIAEPETANMLEKDEK